MYWGFVCNDCIFANFENPALLKKGMYYCSNAKYCGSYERKHDKTVCA